MPAVALTHGMFAWADLATPDPDDAEDFYGGLFGWVPAPLPGHPNAGYTLFTLEGDRVAGLVGLPPAMKDQGVPARWLSYVLVDDVDAAAARVPGLGGSVVRGPMDVVDSGRVVTVQDPSGGSLSLWQAGRHVGAERFNEAGCMIWNELLTRDPDAARAFLGPLLGWGWQSMTLPTGGTYHVCTVGERRNGGVMAMPTEVPAEVPPFWDVYFAVDDVDAAVARAADLGGSVFLPPMDIPVGRLAGVRDRCGATFTVFRPTPLADAAS